MTFLCTVKHHKLMLLLRVKSFIDSQTIKGQAMSSSL